MRIARLLKWLAGSVVVLVLALGLVLVGLAAYLESDSGERRVAKWTAAALSQADRRVEVGRLQIGWPDVLELSGVTVADAKGEWLTIDSLHLTWRPSVLLRARLAVDHLEVSNVEWTRLPESLAERTPDETEPPSLPLAVSIASFRVTSLRFGPDVLGAAAVLRLEGEFGAEAEGEVRSRVHIVRTDGSPAEATLEALLRPEPRWLSLEVAVDEPAGGLLPNLIGVRDQPFSLRLEGSGPLSAWQGKLAARLGERPLLDLEIAVAETPELNLDLAGRLDLSRHLPELASPELAFEARLASEDGRRWRIARSRLAFDWLEATVNGEVALTASPSLALDYGARQLDDAPLPFLPSELRLGAVSATGRVEGPLDAPTTSLKLRAEMVELSPISSRKVALDAIFRPGASLFDGIIKGPLELSGTVGKLRIADEKLAPLLDGPASGNVALDIDSSQGRIETKSLRLALSGAMIEGMAEHGLESGTGGFSGTVTLPELSPVGAAAGIGLSGEAGIRAELRWNMREASISGTVDGQAQRLRFADERLSAVLGTTLSFSAGWQAGADGAFSLRTARLDGRRLRLTGEATLSPGTDRLDARLRAEVPDVAPLASLAGVEAAGRAEVTVRMSGALRAPEGKIELRVTEAVVNGTTLGTVEGKAEAVPADGGLRGTLQVSAVPPPGPVRLNADFRRQGERTRFQDLRLGGSGLELHGALSVADENLMVAGELAVEAIDLAPWLRLAGIDGSGALTGEVALAPRDGRQGIEAKGTLGSLRISLGDRRVMEGERMTFQASGVWPADGAESRLLVGAENFRLDEAVVTRLTAEASGDLAALRFEIEAEGRYRTEFRARLGGRLSSDGEATTVELAHLDARLLETAVTLKQPTRVRSAAGGVAVEAMQLAAGAGSLDLDGRLDRKGVALRLRGEGLSLSPLAALGAEVEGRLDASLEVHGDWPTPTGTATLAVDGVRWRGFDDMPSIAGRMTAVWREGRVALRADLDSGTGAPLRLTAALPLRMTAAPWAVLVPPEAPVSLEVVWQGEAAAIWRLLPYPVHRLEGALAIDLRVAGTVGQPALDGRLTLSRGEYEHLELGTLLRDLELDVVTDGSNRLQIARLTASDGAGGRLSGQGEVTFRELARLAYASRINLENFYVVRRDDLSGRVDGTIAIAGTATGGSIKGRLTTRSVEATLIDSLAADVVELQVVEIGGDRPPADADEVAGRHFNLALDLEIVVPNRAFLRGRGLDSEWAGEIKVTGTTTAPVVTGKLGAVRGRFTILGKTFVLGTSTVEIVTKEGEPDALLNISATHSSRDLDVNIAITGSASSPSFSWSSQPALPRDEIIARLLFGKGTGQLTAFEAVQLAGALAELSGRGPSTGTLLDRARRTLGVDTLRLTGDATAAGGAKIEAGKYLSDRVYVGVQQGATAGTSGARIELQVLPRVTIESEVQPTGANIGAKFKWDY